LFSIEPEEKTFFFQDTTLAGVTQSEIVLHEYDAMFVSWGFLAIPDRSRSYHHIIILNLN